MTDRIRVTWPLHLSGVTGIVRNWPTEETANVTLDNGEDMVLHVHNFESVSNPDVPDWADLEVTYTDGHVEVIREVRYQVSPDDPNPIETSGDGIVRIETVTGDLWSLMGVRKMRFL